MKKVAKVGDKVIKRAKNLKDLSVDDSFEDEASDSGSDDEQEQDHAPQVKKVNGMNGHHVSSDDEENDSDEEESGEGEELDGEEESGEGEELDGEEESGEDKDLHGEEMSGEDEDLDGEEMSGEDEDLDGEEMSGEYEDLDGEEMSGEDEELDGEELSGKDEEIDEEGEADSGDEGSMCEDLEESHAPGVVLCVNMLNYKHRPPKDRRNGSLVDVKSVYDLFKTVLQFKVIRVKDPSKKKFIHQVRLGASKLKGYPGPFILFVMGHGMPRSPGQKKHSGSTGVQFSDGSSMSIDEILHLFTEDQCAILENRHKVVVMEACRGSKVLIANPNGEGARLITYKADSSSDRSSAPVDRLKDVMVFCSSLKNRVSFLTTSSGSVFITVLCAQILTHLQEKRECDMYQVATSVIDSMTNNHVQIRGKRHILTPEISKCTFTKNLIMKLPESVGGHLRRAQIRINELLNRLVTRAQSNSQTRTAATSSDSASASPNNHAALKQKMSGDVCCNCKKGGCKENSRCKCRGLRTFCDASKCLCLQMRESKCTNTPSEQQPSAPSEAIETAAALQIA